MSFSFCRNTVNDEADVMSSARPFHSFGPAEANDRLRVNPSAFTAVARDAQEY